MCLISVAAAMPLAGFSLGGGNNPLGAAAGLRMPGVQTTGSVLLISNLNEEVTFASSRILLLPIH